MHIILSYWFDIVLARNQKRFTSSVESIFRDVVYHYAVSTEYVVLYHHDVSTKYDVLYHRDVAIEYDVIYLDDVSTEYDLNVS